MCVLYALLQLSEYRRKALLDGGVVVTGSYSTDGVRIEEEPHGSHGQDGMH